MSRAQQGQVTQQAQQENSTYNTNANTSFDTTNKDIASYGDAVGAFKAANPYVQGGQAEVAADQQLADTSAGQAKAAGQAIQSAAVRTGQNAGGAIAATENMQEENERNLVGEEGKATADRLAAGSTYAEAGLNDQAKVAGLQDDVAQQQAQAAQGALGTQEQAANTPSFMDELGQGLIGGGEAAITAFCPAKGTLYLMADGTEILVEQLKVGDKLEGIDGEEQVIEEILSTECPILKVTLDNGAVVHNSAVHAFALPFGGFTEAVRSMGKMVRTASGRAKVILIEDGGVATVYNVITDGSHTYRADGVWALGVGEAEREVSMQTWQKLGAQLAEAVKHGG